MDKLEGIYKEKLYDFESHVSESVWTAISASLDRKNRNKRILLYLGIIAILALLISGIYFGMKPDTKSEKLLPKTSPSLVKNDEIYYEIDNSDSYITDNEINSGEGINLRSGKIKSNINKFIPEVNISIKPGFEYYDEVYDQVFANASLSRSLAEFKIIPGRSMSINLQNKKNNIIHETFKGNFNNYADLRKKKGFLDDCFPSKINSWLLEAYASPFFADKSLTGNNSNLIKSRINSEYPLLSYSVGIRLGYNYKGLVFKYGVDYTAINEKFKIVLKNVTSTQTIITIDTIKHSDGTFTITRDTTIKELYGEEDIKKFNNYRMLGIPFIIGYELKYQKHTFGLNAGIIVNLLLRKSGFVLDENGKTIDLDLYGDNIFRNRTGASLYSSLFYTYSLNNRFAIFAEPRFTFDLYPITKKEYALRQKYFTYGISFGGRFLF